MKVLNDAEFLLLYDLYSPQNLDLPCDLYPHFDLQNLTEDECVAEFRFRKTDIPWLSQALRIPDGIVCHQGTICEGTEGLCMLLKRLCYPCRYSDMVHLFARPVPVLCMITNQVLDYIYQAHSHRILQWNHQQLSQANLERFAEVVHRKGAPLNNCFAFVDGTVRPICRPGTVNQRLLYNGHKRINWIKFQSVEWLQICMALVVSFFSFRKWNLGFIGWGGNCLSVLFFLSIFRNRSKWNFLETYNSFLWEIKKKKLLQIKTLHFHYLIAKLTMS